MKKYQKILKRIFIAALILIIISGISIYVCNDIIINNTASQIYSKKDLAQIPHRKAALLLGTSKTVRDGRLNQYYQYRIEAVAELYKAGKIDYIIVSGDNTRKDYNEPEEMKNSLIEQGIPADKIVEDFAGVRTLDSVLRAEAIFGQTDYIIVSQQFHNERALCLGNYYGHKAIAYNAQEVNKYFGFKTAVREYFARVKAVLDLYLFKTEAKHYGEKIDLVHPPVYTKPAEK